jgi:hypothetical protein
MDFTTNSIDGYGYERIVLSRFHILLSFICVRGSTGPKNNYIIICYFRSQFSYNSSLIQVVTTGIENMPPLERLWMIHS